MSEMDMECQWHSHCGNYCETDEERKNCLCHDCLIAEREEDAERSVNQKRDAALARIASAAGIDATDADHVANVVCSLLMQAAKPLFIPLKAEHFDAFAAGTKRTEFRPYGPRWNEKTCTPGRALVLSRGYGKKHRLYGVVAAFERSNEPTKTAEWRDCYGDRGGDAACIGVTLHQDQ